LFHHDHQINSNGLIMIKWNDNEIYFFRKRCLRLQLCLNNTAKAKAKCRYILLHDKEKVYQQQNEQRLQERWHCTNQSFKVEFSDDDLTCLTS